MKLKRQHCIAALTTCLLLSLACSLGGLTGSDEAPAAQPTIPAAGGQTVPTKPGPAPDAKPTTAPPAAAEDDGPAGPPPPLEDSYFYNRSGPDGASKNGSLTVSEFGIGYQFKWDDNIGLALKSGPALAVAAGEECGVVFYDILPDKSLASMWMDWGGVPGTEFLKPTTLIQGKDLSGEYAIEGYNPDGSAYGGAVTINPLGSIYSVYWATGSGSNAADYYGIGIARDARLAVAYGGDHCLVYLYHIQPDGSLDGTIGNQDGRIGAENAAHK